MNYLIPDVYTHMANQSLAEKGSVSVVVQLFSWTMAVALTELRATSMCTLTSLGVQDEGTHTAKAMSILIMGRKVL